MWKAHMEPRGPRRSMALGGAAGGAAGGRRRARRRPGRRGGSGDGALPATFLQL